MTIDLQFQSELSTGFLVDIMKCKIKCKPAVLFFSCFCVRLTAHIVTFIDIVKLKFLKPYCFPFTTFLTY